MVATPADGRVIFRLDLELPAVGEQRRQLTGVECVRERSQGRRAASNLPQKSWPDLMYGPSGFSAG